MNAPENAILLDIMKEIKSWQEEGDHIIVLTNFNEAVTEAMARQWVTNLELVEAITWVHNQHPPTTFQRGSQPIDGIFMALQLLVQAVCGYLSFGDAVPSNHRTIWVDLHLPDLCPKTAEGYVKPGTHRLHCKDLCTITQYNQTLLETLEPTTPYNKSNNSTTN